MALIMNWNEFEMSLKWLWNDFEMTLKWLWNDFENDFKNVFGSYFQIKNIRVMKAPFIFGPNT